MNQSRYQAAMSRRTLLGRLAAAGASYIGLTAFTRGARSSVGPKWDDAFELAVDFDVAQQTGARSHRPYVAIWIEDTAGNPVRTLSLMLNNEGKGPRYHKELKRWFSEEEKAKADGGPDLIATVSSATRLPGKYDVTWNGRDDRGKVVEQGEYRVLIEAAREHGTYQLMQQDVTLTTKPQMFELKGNEEIAGARVEYRRRK